MKKFLALALSVTLVMGMVTGCASKAESVKTGLSVVSSVEKSASVGEKDGLGQVDSVVVAVLVDAAGKIVDCKIDSAQTKINFNAEGKLVTDLTAVQQSKQELGDAYGMKGNSGIGKEWYEQVDSLAKYVVGKTVDEVKSIAVSETSVPTDADLSATVTIKIAGYIDGIEKAVANAKDLGAKEGDKLGLAINTSIADSKDATAEEEGVAQANSDYAAVSVDKKGKITSVAIDSSQSPVNFNVTGVVTTDLTAELKTKQELGAAYGMVIASSIGKEWFEQVDAFAKYATGKTASEVTGIKLTEGKPAETDLASSVTMHIGPYMSVVAKAANNAK